MVHAWRQWALSPWSCAKCKRNWIRDHHQVTEVGTSSAFAAVGTGGQVSQGTAVRTGAAGSRAGNSTFAGEAGAGRLLKVDADAVESGPARTGVAGASLSPAMVLPAITGDGTGDGGKS